MHGFDRWFLTFADDTQCSHMKQAWTDIADPKVINGNTYYVTRRPVRLLTTWAEETLLQMHVQDAPATVTGNAYAFRLFESRASPTEDQLLRYYAGLYYPDDRLVWYYLADIERSTVMMYLHGILEYDS
jgi:hypothetical protein